MINMEEAKLTTLEQIKVFWDETSEMVFRVPKKDRNAFIEHQGHFLNLVPIVD